MLRWTEHLNSYFGPKTVILAKHPKTCDNNRNKYVILWSFRFEVVIFIKVVTMIVEEEIYPAVADVNISMCSP